MILFDSQKRAPVAVKGRTLRFQQDARRFLDDSMYYFELPVSQLRLLMEGASPADGRPGDRQEEKRVAATLPAM